MILFKCMFYWIGVLVLVGVMFVFFLVLFMVFVEECDSFKLVWIIYVGWMFWKYVDEFGIMDKWVDKYDIDVEIIQINDYIEFINQFIVGQYDVVILISMDVLLIFVVGGVDFIVLLIGDYFNGNDGLVMKDLDGGVVLLKGEIINLVELLVFYYLLVRVFEEQGLSECDVNIVNILDVDIVVVFSSEDVCNIVIWNLLFIEVVVMFGVEIVFDFSQIFGYIKDFILVNIEILKDNLKLGKVLIGVWYEVMVILKSNIQKGEDVCVFFGQVFGIDQKGYED